MASKTTYDLNHTQGNISNRDGQSQKQHKSTKRKTSITDDQPERGNGRAAKANDNEPASEKIPAKRRVSPRLESLAAVTGKSLGDEMTTKHSEANRLLPTKQPNSKQSGMKRSSNDEDIATQPSGRTSKRPKKPSEVKPVVEPVVVRRSTRSRSLSSSASSRGKNATKNTTKRLAEEVAIISADDNRVVPNDFGLQRTSFKRDNFTYGIAYYDASGRSDPLLCKDYVTDMFQQLYHAEVSSGDRLIVCLCPPACLVSQLASLVFFRRPRATQNPTWTARMI